MTVPIITMKRYFLQQRGINTDTRQNRNVRNLTKGKYTRSISQFESAEYKKNSYYWHLQTLNDVETEEDSDGLIELDRLVEADEETDVVKVGVVVVTKLVKLKYKHASSTKFSMYAF